MLHYCKKCGRIAEESYVHKEQICDCCKSILLPIPPKYLLEGFDMALKNDEAKELLIEELVKTSSDFDQYLFEHRDEILTKQHAEFNAKLAYGRAYAEGKNKGNKFGVSCPYCGATNTKKISTGSRLLSTGLFGLASKTIGKNFKCSSCGSTF